MSNQEYYTFSEYMRKDHELLSPLQKTIWK